MLIKEILNKKIEFTVREKTDDVFITSAKIGGRYIIFSADRKDENWDVDFVESDTDDLDSLGTHRKTGSGNQLEVFSMVKDSILELIRYYIPETVTFSAGKDRNDKNTRADTYERLLQRFKIPRYSFEKTDPDNVGYTHFKLVRT